jgi:hypothetical protein
MPFRRFLSSLSNLKAKATAGKEGKRTAVYEEILGSAISHKPTA